MAIIYPLVLFCVAAVGAVPAQKTSEVIIPGFTLFCEKPLVFSGKDDEAACFAKCTPGKCQAAVHMFSGQPGKPTCAIMPAGANCKPSPVGPHTLKLSVPTREMFSIQKTHHIGGGQGVTGSIEGASYLRLPASKSGYNTCLAFCQFLGCNAILTDSDICQLLKLTKRAEVFMKTSKGAAICHTRSLVYYENDKIAPAGQCFENESAAVFHGANHPA